MHRFQIPSLKFIILCTPLWVNTKILKLDHLQIICCFENMNSVHSIYLKSMVLNYLHPTRIEIQRFKLITTQINSHTKIQIVRCNCKCFISDQRTFVFRAVISLLYTLLLQMVFVVGDVIWLHVSLRFHSKNQCVVACSDLFEIIIHIMKKSCLLFYVRCRQRSNVWFLIDKK